MATQMSRPEIMKEDLIFITTAFMMARDPPPRSLHLSPQVSPGRFVKAPKVLIHAVRNKTLGVPPLTSCLLPDKTATANVSWDTAAPLGNTVPCPGLHCLHNCSYRERTLSFPLSLLTHSLSMGFSLSHRALSDQMASFYIK